MFNDFILFFRIILCVNKDYIDRLIALFLCYNEFLKCNKMLTKKVFYNTRTFVLLTHYLTYLLLQYIKKENYFYFIML